MKVLLDTCVWGGAKETLAAAGHDVVWSGDWPDDPGDDEILAYAFREERILVTLDKDFGELVFFRRQPHCGVVRLVGVRATQQGAMAVELLTRYATELQRGAVITASPHQTRIRYQERAT